MQDAIETKDAKSPMNPNHSKQSIPKENWRNGRDCLRLCGMRYAMRWMSSRCAHLPFGHANPLLGFSSLPHPEVCDALGSNILDLQSTI
jgi:hypothetical protein